MATITRLEAATLAGDVASDVADEVASDVADDARCHAPAFSRSRSAGTRPARTPTLYRGHAHLCACLHTTIPSRAPEVIAYV